MLLPRLGVKIELPRFTDRDWRSLPIRAQRPEALVKYVLIGQFILEAFVVDVIAETYGPRRVPEEVGRRAASYPPTIR
jgi:hypothetical protein